MSADKVSNQKRNQLSSPSPHLWTDRSTQEDAGDAEKKDRLASRGYGRDWLKGWPYDATRYSPVYAATGRAPSPLVTHHSLYLQRALPSPRALEQKFLRALSTRPHHDDADVSMRGKLCLGLQRAHSGANLDLRHRPNSAEPS